MATASDNGRTVPGRKGPSAEVSPVAVAERLLRVHLALSADMERTRPDPAAGARGHENQEAS
jgi:hypothetical protein